MAWTVKPPTTVGKGPEWARRTALWALEAEGAPAAVGPAEVCDSEEHPASPTTAASTGKTARANERVNVLMDVSSNSDFEVNFPPCPEGASLLGLARRAYNGDGA